MSKYVETAIKQVNEIFKQAEKEWPEEFEKDALISDDEEKLLQMIEEKPKMLIKWESRIVKIKKIRGFLKTEADKLYASLYVDILKNSEINFSQREIEKQIKARPEYVEIIKAIEKCDIVINEIESFLNHIKNIHWDIKNMIEIKKLIYGATV